MSFVNSLFGTIAGTSFSRQSSDISFIPVDDKGHTIQIKGDSVNWLGLKSRTMQKYAYDYCYPVASVVDRLAEYDITGVIEVLNSKGKGKENFAKSEWATRMNRLLAQPNPMQSWEQFRGQQVIYKKIFGFCPVLPFVPAGMTPDYATSMINLPPWLFDSESTKNIVFVSKQNEIVKQWKITILGKSFTFTSDQVIILEDSFMQDEESDFLLPQSRLVGLDMAVSNICRAMEANNVLLTKRGPLGFISHEGAKDVAGTLPMNPDEKKELQDSLRQYGLSLEQYQYVISRTPSRWNPMSYDVNQLGILPTVTAGEKAICHRFGFPYVLYEEIDATFANSSTAAKAVYQNNVIPNNAKDLNKYNKFFKSAENSAKIVGNFLHIAALQEDAKMQAEAANTLDQALSVEYNNNLITKNQWLTARGYDTVPDGDIYKAGSGSDPLAVKLGVGGTQSLIDLLANPSLNEEAKKNGLVILFGMTPEDAAKLVSKPVDQDTLPV